MRRTSSSKNKRPGNKNKKIKIVLIIVVLGYISSILISQQIEIEGRKQALAKIEEQIAQQQQAKEELEQKMELAGSPEYLEKIAREQLGFARPDEIIFYDATQKK